MGEEEEWGIPANLSEEELAVFDLLTKPGPWLTERETERVKQAARELLATLNRERLVLDWRKRQQTRARVKLVIEQTLYERLPNPTYSLVEVTAKTEAVYQHVYDAYQGAGRSVYEMGGYVA